MSSLPRGGIYGVFLAAGRSSRMGRPKLALPFRGGTIGGLALAAALASSLDGVIAITPDAAVPDWLRREGAAVQSACAQPCTTTANRLGARLSSAGRLQLVPCAESASGQAFSLRCGVSAAAKLSAEAIVVLLGDQPLLTAEAIDRLLSVYRSEGGLRPSFVAASRADDGIPLPPVLFDSAVFPNLLRLSGDEGARKLLRGPNARNGIVVRFGDPELFLDIDTPEAYDKLLQMESCEEGPNCSAT